MAPQNFWIPVHPVTIVLLIVALIANWTNDRRLLIASTLGGYLIILGVTFLYYVPELMALTQMSFSESVDAALTDRAQRWELLSLVRLGFLFLLAITLLWSLVKPIDARSYRRF